MPPDLQELFDDDSLGANNIDWAALGPAGLKYFSIWPTVPAVYGTGSVVYRGYDSKKIWQ